MALVLVTGASTGLGLATATALAEAGHDVVLHARNTARTGGDEAWDGMREIIHGDLAHADETVRLAERANGIGRFDAVVHNAGVLDGPDVYAVNIVAPYLLTALMTPPKRTILLGSSMHMGGSTDLSAVDFGRPGVRAYETSKLHVTALAMALAARHPDTMVHTVDPGWVPTRMGGPGAPDDLDEGHRTQVWLATAPEGDIAPRSGAYWHHRAPRRPHPAAHDARFQRELLAALASYTGVVLPA
ncbi:SDR family NAD(P)-dependent oxidoreductase [Microbacterium sp.]|uniref:SDR family NAD(P)-dependent oxidoreductase n=1 Tax=Microbacterium sp. TaxID=51671 RepID=UPI003221CA07